MSTRRTRRHRRALWDNVPSVLLMTVTTVSAAVYLYAAALSDCHNAALTSRAAVNPHSAVCKVLP